MFFKQSLLPRAEYILHFIALTILLSEAIQSPMRWVRVWDYVH